METPRVSQTIKFSGLKCFQHAKAKIRFMFGEFGETRMFSAGYSRDLDCGFAQFGHETRFACFVCSRKSEGQP